MMTKLEDILGTLLHDKMPRISNNLKSIAVRFLPWIIIFLGVIGLISITLVLGIFSTAAAVAVSTTGTMTMHFLTSYDLILLYVLSPLSSILAILSGYWMLNQQLRGWRLALLSSMLGFIIHVLHINILGIALNLFFIYLLFQIREYYHN
ncbi:MAG: hypothetical protein H6Q68_1466 [Firmicutes bacterium]|nr:hypothetical protein [Bacillota bacterium]